MTSADFSVLPIDKLHEAKLNPRRHFDPEKLKELTASIKAHGILTPLLVRPNASGYEIAAGHRRYRAAKAAGVDQVPAIIRAMTDVEFLEVLVIENDKHEDVHPLEEADGYRSLLEKGGYDVARIAERVGRSVKYVYDRVKLLALTKEARELFFEGRITAGHAILLARLKPDDQKRAMDEDTGGLFQHEQLLWDPAETRSLPKDSLKTRSVRELQAWIDQHVRFDPDAPDVPDLFPESAAAVGQAREQAEKIVPITHEHYIQPEARAGRTYGPRSWKRADGKQKSKPCEKAVTGVVVVGPGRGEAFKVCVEKTCRTHWAAEQREAQQRATSVAKSGKTGQDRWRLEQQKRQEEQARREAEHARWTKALPAILEAIAEKVKKAPTRSGGLLGQIVVDAVKPYRGIGKAEDYVPRGTTADDLIRHAAFIVLHTAAGEWGAFKEFPKHAKAFGVDVRKILDEEAPVPAAATGKPVQASATKKAKR